MMKLLQIENLLGVAITVKPVETIAACRDRKDNIFLELALAADASYLISGDPDLLVLHPFRGIPIISASDFLQNL
jgi:putative PIN family toxin of toxin-antitoxin system